MNDPIFNDPFQNGWMTHSVPTSSYNQSMAGYSPPRSSVIPDRTEPKRGIAGRIVGSESEIMPGEVPMTGEWALFPLSDGTKIFAKKWTSMGTIETMIFTNGECKEQPDALTIINQRLDRLEAISKNHKPYYKNKPKKEVPNNAT